MCEYRKTQRSRDRARENEKRENETEINLRHIKQADRKIRETNVGECVRECVCEIVSRGERKLGEMQGNCACMSDAET